MDQNLLAIVALAMLGLCMGSFVNATVWRIRQQAEHHAAKPKKARSSKSAARELSILRGRSMCVHCRHTLGIMDLVPLFSWLILRGKCRYCHQPIDDSPWVELAMPLLFVASYIWWPNALTGTEWIHFGVWLVELVLLGALLVYDARWMLLPNRLVFPLTGLAGAYAVYAIVTADTIGQRLLDVLLATAIAGGIFYILFRVSDGRWIGGGDVKLGYALGLIVLTPVHALLLLFIASLLGTVYALPSMALGKLGQKSRVPFGPFLITGAVLVVLFGKRISDWYLGGLGY